MSTEIRPEPVDISPARTLTRSTLGGFLPLALVALIFIAYAVPPYLSLDPAQART
jgi:hypothetical protein